MNVVYQVNEETHQFLLEVQHTFKPLDAREVKAFLGDTEPGVVRPVALGRDSALRLLYKYPVFALVLDIPLRTLYMSPVVAAQSARWIIFDGSTSVR